MTDGLLGGTSCMCAFAGLHVLVVVSETHNDRLLRLEALFLHAETDNVC